MPWVRVVGVVALACGALVAYDLGVRRLRGRRVAWPWVRGAAFTIGVVLIAASSSAPVPGTFSGRVVEHVLVGMVGPWALVLGRPVTLALRAGGRARSSAHWVLRSPVGARLTHPLVALVAFALGPWLLWLTPLYELEARSEPFHLAVHLHLVASGALFAVAVLGLEPTRWRPAHGLRLLSAALVLPVHTVLGLVLLSSLDPDRRAGGALLWAVGDGLATITLLLIGLQWAAADRRPDAPSATPVVRAGILGGAAGPIDEPHDPGEEGHDRR